MVLTTTTKVRKIVAAITFFCSFFVPSSLGIAQPQNQEIQSQDRVTQDRVTIEWRATADQADQIIQSLNFKGNIETEERKTDTKAFPVVVVLVGAVAVDNLATTLINVYRQSQTGVIISQTPPDFKVTVTPDKNLPRGCIIYTDGKIVKPCIFNETTPQSSLTELILGLIGVKR